MLGATTATTTSNAFASTGVAAQLPTRGDDVPVSHRRQMSEEVEHSTPIVIRGRAATQERTPAALSARGEIEGYVLFPVLRQGGFALFEAETSGSSYVTARVGGAVAV